MTNQPSMGQSALIYLIVAVLLVLRFCFRELRERRMKPATAFVLPGIFVLLALWVTWTTLRIAPYIAATLGIALGAAVVVGLGLGMLVAHFTTVRRLSAEVYAIRGSWTTVGIWVGALALRLVGRLAVAESRDLGQTMMLNSALVALVCVALITVRVRVLQRGAALPVPAVSGTA